MYAGSGAPSASQGKTGDYYLDKASFDLYGPKKSSGWGTPINIKGADGNANVTRYIFPGHDFWNDDNVGLTIPVGTRTAFKQSVWLTYLVYKYQASNGNTLHYFQIPGYGRYGDSMYSVDYHHFTGNPTSIYCAITKEEGGGDVYNQIIIVRIRATNKIDFSAKAGGKTITPIGLDVTDYQAVADYYGFGGGDN